MIIAKILKNSKENKRFGKVFIKKAETSRKATKVFGLEIIYIITSPTAVPYQLSLKNL